MTFSLTLSNIKKFKTVLETLSEIVNDIYIDILDVGFTIQALCLSQSCFMDILIVPQDFENFEFYNNVAICLNIKSFLNILKICNKNDKLQIKYNDDDFIEITFNNKS